MRRTEKRKQNKAKKLTLAAFLKDDKFLRKLCEWEAVANNPTLVLAERKKNRRRIEKVLKLLIPDLRRSKQGMNPKIQLFVRYEEIKEELQATLKREYRNPAAEKRMIKEIFFEWTKRTITEGELEMFRSCRRIDDQAAMIAVCGASPKLSLHTLLAGYKKMQRSLKTLEPVIKVFVSRMKKLKLLSRSA